MPSHEPGRKRKPFRARKRAAVKPRETPAIYEPIGLGATYAYGLGESEEAELQIPKTVGKLKELASLVWSSDYALLFQLEQAALEGENHLMTGATLLKQMAEPSTYAKRGLQRVDRAAQQNARAMDMAAAAMRQANQQKHCFSVCVRSLAALSRRVCAAQWNHQRANRALLSRSTTVQFLRMVMAVSSLPASPQPRCTTHCIPLPSAGQTEAHMA